MANSGRCATCGEQMSDVCARWHGAELVGPPAPNAPSSPAVVDVVPLDEPLLGPPAPRRWRAPAVAAAILIVIAVGVTVRGGGRVSGLDGAAANTTGPTLVAPTTVPAVIASATTASTNAAPTTTTMAPLARIGEDGEPLLGSPLGLSLYVAHPAGAATSAFLERVDLDSGERTRIPFAHAENIRQMAIVGDELVVIGDDISAIGPNGTRTVLGGQGFERSLHGEVVSMIVTDNGLTVLRTVNVRDRSAPVDVPLPAGTTRAYPDGTGRVVYDRPGGGVFWKSLTGTGEPKVAGYGSLRSAEQGRFQDASCDAGPCRLMLHDLEDEKVRTVFEGPAAVATVGVVDHWNNYMWMATAPGSSDGTSTLLRLGDNKTITVAIALAPLANCTIEPCPAALPVWSDGGEALFGVSATHHVFAWHAGLETPLRLDELGDATALAVGATDSGPNAPG